MKDKNLKEIQALLRKLKKLSNEETIFWDIRLNWTSLGVKENEILGKLNQVIENGRIKMDVDIFWKDKAGKQLNSYYSTVSSQKWEQELPQAPIKGFKLDLGAVLKASEKLIQQVKEREPKNEEYIQKFLTEWQETVIKNPLVAPHEIEQSVKFVYENKLFISGLVKKAIPYKEYVTENEINEFIQNLQAKKIS